MKCVVSGQSSYLFIIHLNPLIPWRVIFRPFLEDWTPLALACLAANILLGAAFSAERAALSRMFATEQGYACH